MTGAYAGLRLAARAGEPDPENPDNQPEDEKPEDAKKKENEMTDDDHKAAVAEAEQKARAEGAAEATRLAGERFSAVLASEHYAGREKLAATLLGNDKLSADEIVAALAATDKPAPPVEEDADAAARAAMSEALGETANSGLETGDGGKTDNKAKSDAVWNRAWGLDPKGVK